MPQSEAGGTDMSHALPLRKSDDWDATGTSARLLVQMYQPHPECTILAQHSASVQLASSSFAAPETPTTGETGPRSCGRGPPRWEFRSAKTRVNAAYSERSATTGSSRPARRAG